MRRWTRAASKRKGLQHPLGVGISATVRLQQQPRGDLRVLLRELRSHLAQERELAFVIVPQLIAHRLLP